MGNLVYCLDAREVNKITTPQYESHLNTKQYLAGIQM